jgi:hypothetical protein
MFTMFIMVTAVAVWFAYEIGYDKAVRDIAEKYEIISE